MILGYTNVYGGFAEREVDKIMKNVDSDGSGEIDYNEWLMATMDRKNLLSDEKLKTAFNYFDKNNNGSISVDEIKAVLGVKKQLVED